VNDPRLVFRRHDGGDVDGLAHLFARCARGTGVEHQRGADLDLVSAGEVMVADPLAVDKGAVGAVEIGDGEIAVAAAQFGVMAGDFGVVDLDHVRGVASHPEDGVRQLETCALVVSANHEQRWHGSALTQCGYQLRIQQSDKHL